MNTISAAAFLKAIAEGQTQFTDLRIEGDIDLGELRVSTLSLENVISDGEVTGHITVGEIHVYGPNCIFFAYRPSCYTGSLFKEVTS